MSGSLPIGRVGRMDICTLKSFPSNSASQHPTPPISPPSIGEHFLYTTVIPNLVILGYFK